MTTNTLKVLRDAVEALEYACEHKCDAEYNPCMYQESALELQTLIASLEAQPVGEPLGYIGAKHLADMLGPEKTWVALWNKAFGDTGIPVYAAPVQPVVDGWTLVPIGDLKELYHSIHGNRFMGEDWEKKAIASMMPKERKDQ